MADLFLDKLELVLHFLEQVACTLLLLRWPRDRNHATRSRVRCLLLPQMAFQDRLCCNRALEDVLLVVLEHAVREGDSR